MTAAPNIFQNQTGSIPMSELDQNFTALRQMNTAFSYTNTTIQNSGTVLNLSVPNFPLVVPGSYASGVFTCGEAGYYDFFFYGVFYNLTGSTQAPNPGIYINSTLAATGKASMDAASIWPIAVTTGPVLLSVGQTVHVETLITLTASLYLAGSPSGLGSNYFSGYFLGTP